LGAAEAQGLGHLLDGGARLDRDRRLFLDRLGRRGEIRLDPRRAPAAAAAAARGLLRRRRALGSPGRLGVDDHAPPPAAAAPVTRRDAPRRPARTLGLRAPRPLLPTPGGRRRRRGAGRAIAVLGRGG